MAAIQAQLKAVPFRDIALAERNFTSVAHKLSDEVVGALLALLSECPDPDAALNLLERASSEHPDLNRSFQRHPALLHYLLMIFGESEWLGETVIRNADLLQHTFLRERSMGASLSREDYEESFARFRSRSASRDIAESLALFKKREYVRIMLRDVLGIATLAETTAEVSAVADVLISEAVVACQNNLRNRHGDPQNLDAEGRVAETPFAVLGLGKLGGNELNYSSDVDLLFIYGDGPEPASASITNREYFVRLAQDITAMLSKMTREGAAFRIDLRLRPQGGEGAPAVALAHALEYYAQRASDWELQALIKVRYCAGDVALARKFIRGVQAFVYTETLNFAAIETALLSRERIQSHRTRNAPLGRGMDVKLDRGGIRDIEFLVQCLQRVYGGKEAWLRSGGTLFSLQKLHDKGHITGTEFQRLTSAYELLRAAEHRLQVRHGQQTHKVPGDDRGLSVLARGLSPRFLPTPDPDLLTQTLKSHMDAVAEIYSRIVHQQHVVQQVTNSGTQFQLVPSVVGGREQSHQQILERLGAEAPALHQIARRASLAPHTRRNLFRFLTAAFTDSKRYSAVVSAPEAVERAIELFANSELLTDMLVRHPEEIAAVAQIRSWTQSPPLLFETYEDGQQSTAFGNFLRQSSQPYQEKLAMLRRHYRSRVFVSGARDIIQRQPVFAALSETTHAADEAIATALAIADAPAGFTVFALGRLGSREHDVLSDADLIFVREETHDHAETCALASKVVEALSAYTREGTVFPVDTRLRPRGKEGELVVTAAQLRDYFSREAQVWEALTFAKMRFIAGSSEVAEQVIRSVASGTRRFASDAGFSSAIREMRTRLERSESAKNLKTAAGGMYDIDFIAAGLLIRHEKWASGNAHQRLRMLAEAAFLDSEDAKTLIEAAELYRATEHAIRLATGVARKTLPVSGPARDAVESLVRGSLRRDFPEGLDAALGASFHQVREVFDRVFQ